MLEAADLLQVTRDSFASIPKRLGVQSPTPADHVRGRAIALKESETSIEALRHLLWRRLTRALDVGVDLPLSVRTARTAANGIGFKAAERLSPGVHAARRKRRDGDGSWLGLSSFPASLAEAIKTLPKSALATRPPLPFPEIVAHEIALILGHLDADALERSGLDPTVAETLRSGRAAALAALAAGGGWAAAAAAVSGAGFAPYIVAAQLSAFVPFLSGTAATSLLATLVNPLTVVLGIAAIGGVAAVRGGGAVRADVAARIGVLLAVRGQQSPDDGVAHLVTAFRLLAAGRAEPAPHLDGRERGEMRRRIARIEGRLRGPIPAAHGLPAGPWGAPLRSSRRGNPDRAVAGAVAALTAADMLYHAAAIDPKVLAAADFSRAADIGDPLALAACVEEFTTRGAFASLQGYTAEQVVLHRLIDDGHDVALAATSNTAGYDLLVDGQAVQVKCGQGLGLLSEHFEKHPDIPVIADAGLAAAAAASDHSWTAMVSTVDGFSLEGVRTLVDDALAAAGGLAQTDAPVFAMAVSVARGLHDAWKGAIPARDLPASIALDAAIRGLLSSAGGQAGAVAGLVAIGPAGALILGPVLGLASLLGAGAVRRGVVDLVHADWRRDLVEDGARLHAAYLGALDRRIEHVAARRACFVSLATELGSLRDWIDARAADDAVAAVEALLDAPRPPRHAEEALELLILASCAAPADAGVLRAGAAVRTRLSRRPPLGSWFGPSTNLGKQPV